MVLLLPIIPIIGITGGTGGTSTAGDTAGDTTGGKVAGEGDKTTTADNMPPKTHTQAEVDKAVQDRVSREQKKYTKMIDDMKKQMGDQGAAGTSTDGQAGDTAGDAGANNEVAQKAAAQIAVANQRLIQATALSEAIKLGVDPKYTSDVVKLADLSKVVVGEDGTMDTGAISKAIDAIIQRVPVFKTNSDNAGGFKVGGPGQTGSQSTNPWGNSGTNQTKPAETGKRWNRQNRQ